MDLTTQIASAKETLEILQARKKSEDAAISRAELIELLRRAGSVAMAAERLGLTRSGVYWRCRRLGVKLPRRSIPEDATQFVITHTLAESARHFLVSGEAVRQWCIRHGVTPKKYKRPAPGRSGVQRVV